MSKNLVIVESPAKAKTIEKYLNSINELSQFGKFKVLASFGHIQDLPEIFKTPFCLYVDGYKYNEIAEALNEPLGTIKSRIHFARKILKQKIAKGQWKPIRDNNEVEPIDGYDVVSTIDVYIQDIAHHALLKQLEEYEADHGCVVVMETKTGNVKAISNLGRSKEGTYYEFLQKYWESNFYGKQSTYISNI